MAVEVFSLGHVDPSDFVSMRLAVPGLDVARGPAGGSHIQFSTLENANLLWIQMSIHAVIAMGNDRSTLDSAVLQFISIR